MCLITECMPRTSSNRVQDCRVCLLLSLSMLLLLLLGCIRLLVRIGLGPHVIQATVVKPVSARPLPAATERV